MTFEDFEKALSDTSNGSEESSYSESYDSGQDSSNYSGSDYTSQENTPSDNESGGMTFEKFSELMDSGTGGNYSVQEAAQQANGGQSYVQTAVQDVTGQQAQAPAQQQKPGIFEKPEVKTTPERDALIEEYNNLGNPNYLHTKAERDAYIQKHDELLGQLRAIDEELGNGAMDYNFRDRSQSVLGGSLKGYGADMMNAGATVLSGFNELGERLGGDTGQYAGWATDEVSRAAIPQENNPDAYAQQKQEVADMQAKSDELAQASAADLERAKNNQSKFAQFGTDIATNAIQMGMDALAAGLTGGSSLAPMFVRSAGGGAREARQDGASTAQQLTYGAVRGGIEVATEKMFDGLAKIYGAGFADDAIEKLIGKLGQGNKLVQSGLRWMFSGLGEAAEEGVSGLSEPLTKMIYQGIDALKEYKDPEYWAENMYGMLVGYAMGGAGGAVNLVNGENRKANAEIQEGIDQRNEIKNNLIENNGMSEEDATKASEILAKIANGEKINQKQKAFLDTLQEANGIDTSKPDVSAPQAEAQTATPQVETPAAPMPQTQAQQSDVTAQPTTESASTPTPSASQPNVVQEGITYNKEGAGRRITSYNGFEVSGYKNESKWMQTTTLKAPDGSTVTVRHGSSPAKGNSAIKDAVDNWYKSHPNYTLSSQTSGQSTQTTAPQSRTIDERRAKAREDYINAFLEQYPGGRDMAEREANNILGKLQDRIKRGSMSFGNAFTTGDQSFKDSVMKRKVSAVNDYLKTLGYQLDVDNVDVVEKNNPNGDIPGWTFPIVPYQETASSQNSAAPQSTPQGNPSPSASPQNPTQQPTGATPQQGGENAQGTSQNASQQPSGELNSEPDRASIIDRVKRAKDISIDEIMERDGIPFQDAQMRQHDGEILVDELKAGFNLKKAERFLKKSLFKETFESATGVKLDGTPEENARTVVAVSDMIVQEMNPELLAQREREANAPEEAPPKGWEKTLRDAQQKTEDAQKKAAQQPAPEQPKPLRKIKPYTENEKILAEDRKRLDRENKSLRNRVDKLSKQTKRTDVKTARESDVRNAAKEIVKAHNSDVDIGETTVKMQALADYLVQHTGETIDYDTVQRMAEEIATDIVDNIFTNKTDAYSKERAAAVKKYIKNNTVNVTQLLSKNYTLEDAKSDFPGMKFAKTKGMTVQKFYELLTEEHLVEPDVSGAHDQLMNVYDAIYSGEDNIVPTYENDANYDQAVNETTNEILDTLLSDAVRESEPTFADKQAAKLDATKARMQQQIDAEKEARKADRQASRERLQQFRKQAAEEKKAAVEKERADKYKKLDRYQEQVKNRAERDANKRKTKAQRDKIKQLHKELSDRATKGKENKYVPEGLMDAVVDLLQSVNLETGSVSSAEKLGKLNAELNKLKNDPDYNMGIDDFHQDMLNNLSEIIGGTPLNEMNSAQLDEVYKVMRAISDEVKEGVKANIADEEYQAAEFNEGLTDEVKEAKGWGKTGKLNAIYTSNFARASAFFERLGGFKKNSFWNKAFKGLNDGQTKATDWKVKTAQKFDSLVRDKRSGTFRDTVKLGKDAQGKDITVSRGMMVYLKMLLNNDSSTNHIKYGGITMPGIKDYYSGKNDGGFGTSMDRVFGISPELAKAQKEYRNLNKKLQEIDSETDKTTKEWEDRLDQIVTQLDAKKAEIDALYENGEDYIAKLKGEIDKQLTDYERKWIKTVQEYVNESQVALNKTTMDIYHYKKATVDNYIPIVTDPNFRKANFESIARDMSLENSGFMKARSNAVNPIILLDISEVIADYSDKVANYIGIMPAVREFQKVYGKSQSGYSDSLQYQINNKFGKEASKYIENLIADLQGARRGSDNSIVKALGKTRGNMAQAVLTMNPRVALSQAASILNAASEIGYAPIMKSFSMGTNPMKDAKVMELVTKYSPLLYYRTLGNSNAVVTDIHADAKWQNQVQKKFNWLLGWINTVDQRTVGRLWYASEAYVQQQGTDYAKGTDEYYEEVAKVFNRVVEKTQPNNTAMQKAAILRDPSELLKALTPFMTQRLQNQNILYEAGERLAKYEADFKDGKNDVTEADVKQARKDAVNALSSQILSTSMLVAIKAGTDALMHNLKGYRDDDKKLTKESVLAKIKSMFADAFIGNFLGGTEIYALYNAIFKDARYDGLTVNGIATISETLTDIVSAAKAKPEKQLEKTWRVAEDISRAYGISLENAEKFVNAVWKHGIDIVNGNFGTFDSDLSEGPIGKMTKVDFGYQPVTNMFSPLYNAITQTSTSKDVAKEIHRLYESTGIAGVYPNIRGVNKITVDGEDYDLTGKEGQKYHETAGKSAEQFAKNLMDSKAYKAMSDDQKVQALKTLYSYAKDLAKDEFIADQGIKTDTVTTATSLLKGLDKAGTSNDKTALNEKNLADYVSYTTLLKSNINDGNYKDIDKLVSWYDGMDSNMKTVLKERNTDLKRMLEYKDVGEGSESYFKMKESIIKSQINLDQNANTSAYVRLYAVADCDLPESSKRNIVRNLMQGDDNFISKAGRTAFNTLSEYGMTVAQVAQFFDIAMHCASYKDTGDDKDFKGKLTPENTAYALSQVPWFNDSQRTAIYNRIKAESDNDYKVNDWGNYTYASEVKWFTNAKNKATYGTDVQIIDKREYQTSNALWNAYVGNAS